MSPGHQGSSVGPRLADPQLCNSERFPCITYCSFIYFHLALFSWIHEIEYIKFLWGRNFVDMCWLVGWLA